MTDTQIIGSDQRYAFAIEDLENNAEVVGINYGQTTLAISASAPAV